MMPLARIEAANSSRRSGRKTVRGCCRFGVMSSIASESVLPAAVGVTVTGAGAGAGRGGRRAERPLPSDLRVFSVAMLIFEYFPGEFNVAFCATRAGIVH